MGNSPPLEYRDGYLSMATSTSDQRSTAPVTWNRAGRPSLLTEELTAEVKLTLHNLPTPGSSVSSKLSFPLEVVFLQSWCPEKLWKNSGSIIFSVKWARRILNSMDWIKHRGTAAKRTMNPALYDELSFSWKEDIANLMLQHNIPEEPILNLDQTPLGFTSASKLTFAPIGSKKVPISNINDKR